MFLVAFAARMLPEIVHGAVTGNFGYDASVYYAAADGLVHGRMPYRDYVLLHPPGIVLADAPFAWLGALTTDQIGFAAATVGFALLGSVNAVLVIRVARRLGLPRQATLVAGLVYALWFGALIAEFDARLEPLGCFLLLCGFLALLAAREAAQNASTRSATVLALLAGAAFGATMSVKIWWTVPVLVVLGWELLVGRARRRAGLALGGLVVALLVIDGPFLLAAGSKMWTMVVLDQLNRPVNNESVLRTFGYLLMGSAAAERGRIGLRVSLVIGAALLVWLVVRAWRVRSARVIVVMLLVQFVQLAFEPSWFTFYADFVTVGLALLVGAASVRREPAPAGYRDASPALALGIAAALVTTLTSTIHERGLVTGFPSARLTAAAARYRCVMSDSPMALIDINSLSRGLSDGCPNLVDVVGLHYDLYRRYHGIGIGTVTAIWNADMISYLRAGDATIFMRPPAIINLTAATSAAVERNGLVARAQQYELFRVDRAPRSQPSSAHSSAHRAG